ncbi:hypothetical protein [Cupriavidus necator]|uniref:hypothetical protein n=1 Tax=Cupriavidus necator TaxID=106590 RepID=UPI000045FFA8|nr:hypothetical protein [Cupriavidus necator]
MASQRPAGRARHPRKESTLLRDIGPDTIWPTRGLQSHSRLRRPLPPAQRTPRHPLPPSRVPHLLAWVLVLAMLAALASVLLRAAG